MRFGAGAGKDSGDALQGSSDPNANADDGRLDAILARALLHIGQAYSTPDSWQGPAQAHGLADTRASTSFQAPAANGNRQDRQTGESLRSSGSSKSRREQRLAQDAEDDTLTVRPWSRSGARTVLPSGRANCESSGSVRSFRLCSGLLALMWTTIWSSTWICERTAADEGSSSGPGRLQRRRAVVMRA